jgi:hypothetical protein
MSYNTVEKLKKRKSKKPLTEAEKQVLIAWGEYDDAC